MRNTLRSIRESVRAGFWAVPATCVIVAALAAVGLVALDRELDDDLPFTFGAGPDGAREVLSAITTAMITFTGLVFTITIVVLQLTSSQYSPRVLRTFLRDRLTQWSLGVFTATFVFAVMVLRTVNSGDGDAFVPAIATTVALALLLLSVALFVAYIHHIATSMQASSIIAKIGTETAAALDRRFPPGTDRPVDTDDGPRPTGPVTAVLPARRSGVVTTRDDDRLVALAAHAGLTVVTGVALGDFVPRGAPMLELIGDPARFDADAALGCVAQAQDRTLQQDVAFGFRQLCDIAERALSPGVNDPTTAVQVLDQHHDLLRRLATRPLRTGLHADPDGTVRLATPPDLIQDYLTLALRGIDQYGEDSHPVQERIDALLADVHAAALPQHKTAITQWLNQRRSARPPDEA